MSCFLSFVLAAGPLWAYQWISQPGIFGFQLSIAGFSSLDCGRELLFGPSWRDVLRAVPVKGLGVVGHAQCNSSAAVNIFALFDLVRPRLRIGHSATGRDFPPLGLLASNSRPGVSYQIVLQFPPRSDGVREDGRQKPCRRQQRRKPPGAGDPAAGGRRVSGKTPQLWDPQTGAIRDLPVFAEKDGRITVPLRFEPMQSWFVVFHKREGGAAVGGGENFASPHPLQEITGPWQVTFDPKWGGPEKPVVLEELSDWSKHAEPGVRYYSGTAVYRGTFELAQSEVAAGGGRVLLDLGKVEVMARVRLNAVECGVAWKPPYRVDITSAVRPGKNQLEIDVVNLWINRMIGDEQLPEDGNWKDFETLVQWPDWFKAGEPRPSGCYTFTTCKHYKKDSPLVSSGLLGPVKLQRMAILKGHP